MQFDRARAVTLRDSALSVLEKNRRSRDGEQYTVPSPVSYPMQWLWDSCFHAIALTHFSPQDAKHEIRSLLSAQFENGMLPHMIYRGDGDLLKLGEGFVKIDWGRETTSTITQPPIIAEAVLAVYAKEGDPAFLMECFESLLDFYEYLLTARDPRENHLSGIINPDESGEDNSPRFDGVLGLPPVQTLQQNFESRMKLVQELRAANFDAPFMKQFFWVKDVPFNAILVRNLRAMGHMAAILGDVGRSTRFSDKADLVARAMRDRMYDGDLFWSTYGESYMKIRIETWAIFMPLYAGILSKEEAEHLVRAHLFNGDKFLSKYMLPTVSMSEHTFDPDGFWRGPVWSAVNWFVFRGLLDYGYVDEARRLLEDTASLIELSGFREYYNPHTGAGLGAENFTWGTLIVDMLERAQVKT